ncbi:MAG: hypothetical protein ACYS9C_03270 [Planctomycetota bacterium]
MAGESIPGGGYDGSPQVRTFDYVSETFTVVAPMAGGRLKPGATTRMNKGTSMGPPSFGTVWHGPSCRPPTTPSRAAPRTSSWRLMVASSERVPRS